MNYQKFKPERLFHEINTEKKARDLLWQARCSGYDFICPVCKRKEYWEYRSRPEIRKCKSCHKQIRLRSGTIFENTKKSLLLWVRAIYFVTQGKRGISALELKRLLDLNSYQTAWTMLHKIREALSQRDQEYKLRNTIELDSGVFGRRRTGNQREVHLAIECKDWIDSSGKPKSKAGFAKYLGDVREKAEAVRMAYHGIEPGSNIRTDSRGTLLFGSRVNSEPRVISGDKVLMDKWLPWIHKLISNTKTWMQGTYHGVGSKYLDRYIGEYLYRFNRRHDLDGLFHRALTACLVATPKTYGALFG